MARALITGLSGQDGSYLAELLLETGDEVHGIVRTAGLGAAAHLRGRVAEHRGDLRNRDSLSVAVRSVQPDMVFHLAAPSHVGMSEDQPEVVHDVIAGGTERVLNAVANFAADARVYVASSAEVFGNALAAPQDENTPLHPRNPYGAAKAAALEAVRAARERGLWVSAGILYNHESPRRPREFVTRKVTWHAAAIAQGNEDHLHLGSLDAVRDWGWAPEYAEAARLTLRADSPDDFVFATGVPHTVRDLVDVAFARAGTSPEGRVVIDPKLVRAEERVPIVGDASKARRVLGWEPQVTFEEMIAEMVDHDMSLLSA